MRVTDATAKNYVPPGVETPLPEYVSLSGEFVLFEDNVIVPVLSWHNRRGNETSKERASWAMVSRDGVNLAYEIDDWLPDLH